MSEPGIYTLSAEPVRRSIVYFGPLRHIVVSWFPKTFSFVTKCGLRHDGALVNPDEGDHTITCIVCLGADERRFDIVGTNPCGEVTLGVEDICRLK